VTAVVWVAVAGAATAYLVGVARSRAPWPAGRTAGWLAGLGCVTAALTAPWAHTHDLRAHMAAHLLLGMVAPVLLALARPVTLALRALPPPRARTLAGLLRTTPVRVLTDPFVATALNVGGLWLLYRSDLLAGMAHDPRLHLWVSLHVMATGWLATAAVLALEPTPHRRGVVPRAAALATGMAGHDVLAKTLYAFPPAGFTGVAAGAQLMYNGGTVLHLLVAGALWRQWYRSRGAVRAAGVPTAAA
jgi:putative membrane protein